MKKIVLLVDVIHGLFGGAERQIYELCRNIDRDRFDLTVACLFAHDRLLPKIEECGVRTLRFGLKRIYGWNGIRQGLRFARFLREHETDVLVTYHFGSDIWGTICGRLAGVPCIVSNRRDAGFWRKRRHILFYRLLDRWVHRIIVVSRAVKDVVAREERVRPEKVRVIYNGIDLERFSGTVDLAAMRRALDIPDGKTVIGCVGNLRRVKGHRFLIEAFGMVAREFPDTYLIFIGGMERRERHVREELDVMVKTRGLEQHVRFLGRRKDVPGLLSAMDVCVLPSLSEGFSNTLLEYMAAGKAIIATRAGGNPEIIEDGRNGLLVNKADARDLADKMTRLMKDRQLRGLLGQNARRDAKTMFVVSKMLERYQAFLTEL